VVCAVCPVVTLLAVIPRGPGVADDESDTLMEKRPSVAYTCPSNELFQ